MTRLSQLSVSQLTEAWQRVDALAHDVIAPIEDEAQHARALAALEGLWAEVGEDAGHPLASLLQLLIERIAAYEERAFPMPEAAPHDMLAFLMEQRGVTQKELEAATGIQQGNLSKLLRGKRAFTAQHARQLARFFRVSPALFL